MELLTLEPPALALVTGGVRSGKSRYAEGLAAHFGGDDVCVVATLEARDEEMARRVARHQKTRRKTWRTAEAPHAVTEAVEEAEERVVLLDCLSGWVANIALAREGQGEERVTDAVLEAVEGFAHTVLASQKIVIVVTNEVGLGVVPAYPLGRLYRDALGLANQRLARAADAVTLVTVGIPQALKGHLPEVL